MFIYNLNFLIKLIDFLIKCINTYLHQKYKFFLNSIEEITFTIALLFSNGVKWSNKYNSYIRNTITSLNILLDKLFSPLFSHYSLYSWERIILKYDRYLRFNFDKKRNFPLM